MRILDSMPNNFVPDKARAAVVDDDRNIIFTDYTGCLMLPGGKLDNDETSRAAIERELEEETGVQADHVRKLFTLQLEAINYPERDGTITLVKTVNTDYHLFQTPTIEFGEKHLTEKEQLGKFTTRIARLEELPDIIEAHRTDNERWPFFKEEIQIVVKRLIRLLIERPGGSRINKSGIAQ
jgi:8-oxo-dGTP pyrophosphatase MutT (NUDIX family)